jgi:hypothetical protein
LHPSGLISLEHQLPAVLHAGWEYRGRGVGTLNKTQRGLSGPASFDIAVFLNVIHAFLSKRFYAV